MVKLTKALKEHLKSYQRMKPLIALKEYIMIILCTIPYAIAVNWILVPHTIVGGGLTGLCEILYFASDKFIPIWLSSFVCNLALLIAAFFTVGWRYCVRTLWGVLWYTIWLKVVEIPAEPVITDPFMAVILGGLFMGSFLGIVFLNNGSTGGVDIVAMIVNKFKHLPMGRVLMACDIVIILCAYFLPEIKELPFGRGLEKILFGLCYTFMAGTAVDWVLNRTRQSVQFFIFSTKYEEIAQRMNTRAVGYGQAQNSTAIDRNNMLQYVSPQDLKSFGLIPELVGRLPVLTYLQPLDKQALRNILTEPKNSIIRQYKKLFEMDGIKLTFEEKALNYIVDKAVEFKLGARGLRSICEAIMMDAMYEMPSTERKTLKITEEYARKKVEHTNSSKFKSE